MADPLADELRIVRDRLRELEHRGVYYSTIEDADWREVGEPGNVSFLNGWVNYGSGWPTAAYRKDNEGWVHWRGMVKSGSSFFCQMPADYQPEDRSYVGRIISADNTAGMRVFQNGQVAFINASSSWVNLSGFRYPAIPNRYLQFRRLLGIDPIDDSNLTIPRTVRRRSGIIETHGVTADWSDATIVPIDASANAEQADIFASVNDYSTPMRVDSTQRGLNAIGTADRFIVGGMSWPGPDIEGDYEPLTLENSWVWYGQTSQFWAKPTYYLDGSGYVHVRGMVKSGTSAAATIATLPVGFRPYARTAFPGWCSSGDCRLEVSAGGAISVAIGGSTSWTSLAGIQFLAEN